MYVLAPSAAPQNSTPISGLNITLSYMAPPAIDQNGIITNYTIVYFGIDRDSAIRTITIPPDQFSVNITGLEEDTTYSFRIAANTIVGRGPFTQPVIASTQTARKFKLKNIILFIPTIADGCLTKFFNIRSHI